MDSQPTADRVGGRRIRRSFDVVIIRSSRVHDTVIP